MLKPLRQNECDSFASVTKQINVLRDVANDLARLLAKAAAPPRVAPPPPPEPVKTKTKTFKKGD